MEISQVTDETSNPGKCVSLSMCTNTVWLKLQAQELRLAELKLTAQFKQIKPMTCSKSQLLSHW